MKGRSEPTIRKQARPKNIRNIVANIASYGGSMLVAVFFTPYLVRELGVAHYGMIPVAVSVTQYLSVVTIIVHSSVGRALIHALEEGDRAKAQSVWSTALLILSSLSLALGALALVVVPHVDQLLTIPGDAATGTKRLFAATLATFVVTVFASLFELGMYWQSRFTLRASMIVTGVAIRVCVIVALFENVEPRIEYVGVGLLCEAAFKQVFSQYSLSRLVPQLRFRILVFSKERFRELFSVGTWVGINHAGTLLFLNVDILVVNIVLGSEASGNYGLVLVWVNFLTALSSTVAAVFGPQILASTAGAGRAQDTVRLSQRASRLVAVTMSLPCAVIAGLSAEVMTIWQGESFSPLGALLSVFAMRVAFTAGFQPLASLLLGKNRVRLPALVQVVSGLVSVTAGYFLIRYTDLGLFAPALANSALLFLRSALFTPLYAAYITGSRWYVFLLDGVIGLASFVALAAVSAVVGHWFEIETWLDLLLAGVAITLLAAPLMYMLIMRRMRLTAAIE